MANRQEKKNEIHQNGEKKTIMKIMMYDKSVSVLNFDTVKHFKYNKVQ